MRRNQSNALVEAYRLLNNVLGNFKIDVTWDGMEDMYWNEVKDFRCSYKGRFFILK